MIVPNCEIEECEREGRVYLHVDNGTFKILCYHHYKENKDYYDLPYIDVIESEINARDRRHSKSNRKEK